MCCVAFLCGLTIADPDLWGHTLYGLRAIEAGILTERADPFSYTAPAARWINHEWLTEYQFGWLWSRFGGIGLVLWRNAAVAGFMTVGLLAIRRSRATLAGSVLLLVLTAECLSDFVVFIRPQLATFFLFALFLYVLRAWWDDPSKRIWWLPVFMAAWVNLHGGFLAGIGILAVFASAAALRTFRTGENWNEARQLIAVSLITVAATFVNPYGFELHAMLWEHLHTTQFVREWRPIWAVGPSPILAAPFFLIILTLVFSRRLRPIDIAVLAVVSWQAVSHLRHVALLAISAMILLPGPLSDAVNHLFPQLTLRWSGRIWRARLCVLGICVFLALLQVRSSAELWRNGLAPWDIAVECRSNPPGMPGRAVALLKKLDLHGNIVTDYGWGQFVIWHLYPDSRLAFDGRYRTVYPAVVEQEFIELQKSGNSFPNSTPIIDDYPTDIAVVPIGSGPERYLSNRKDWLCVFCDEQAAVFIPNTAASRELQNSIQQDSQAIPEVPVWTVFPGLSRSGTPIAESEKRLWLPAGPASVSTDGN